MLKTQKLKERSIITHLRFCDAGWSYNQIVNHLKISPAQVIYALNYSNVTPKKSKSRPLSLSQENFDEIVDFITSSENQRITYLELAAGYFRYIGTGESLLLYKKAFNT